MKMRLILTLVICLVDSANAFSEEPPTDIAPFFVPPAEFADDFGDYRSPLLFDDGRRAKTPADWRERREEILKTWHGYMGEWPALIEQPEFEILESTREILESTRREKMTQHKVRVEIDPERSTEGYLLVPVGEGPFPAILIVYYEPETAIGEGRELRGFGIDLAERGFAVLSIGFDPRPIIPDATGFGLQPLSYLAYVAANCHTAMAQRPEIDPERIGVMGHSYGGKWAMFAASLHEPFACGVWSDPGIVFEETRPNINYWEPWYLGWEAERTRERGVPKDENPRTGPYAQMIKDKRDLHELFALMAPRPFLVSGGAEDPPKRWQPLNRVVEINRMLGAAHRVAMTNREGHPPTEESNEQLYRFLEYVLQP